MQGSNIPSSYYSRRANSAENPVAYRPATRILPDPGTLRVDRCARGMSWAAATTLWLLEGKLLVGVPRSKDHTSVTSLRLCRPEGKRQIPEPYGPPPSHGTGTRMAPEDVRFREPGRAPEPAMPRLSRPIGICGLRESENELSHERSLGRKVRVDQHSYRGRGRAGDLSTVQSAPLAPQDADPNFFKTLRDSPTFIRFCNTLPPKPAVSPHERRALQVQRAHQQERERDRQLVSSLQLADPEDG